MRADELGEWVILPARFSCLTWHSEEARRADQEAAAVCFAPSRYSWGYSLLRCTAPWFLMAFHSTHGAAGLFGLVFLAWPSKLYRLRCVMPLDACLPSNHPKFPSLCCIVIYVHCFVGREVKREVSLDLLRQKRHESLEQFENLIFWDTSHQSRPFYLTNSLLTPQELDAAISEALRRTERLKKPPPPPRMSVGSV